MRVRRAYGFTLIEMSIVLAIVGLLAGAILVGRDLIQAAALRNVVAQLERYDTAITAFKLKHDCLPGDCAHASTFGLSDNSCPADYFTCSPEAPEQFAHAGCDGNGNGSLDTLNIAIVYELYCPEYLNVWHHLSRAGLIEGQYDGRTFAASPFSSFFRVPKYGVSAPRTALRDVGIIMATLAGRPGTYFLLGLSDAGDGVRPDRLYSAEAYHVDSKLDDGLPQSGKVLGGSIESGGACTIPGPPRAYNVPDASGRCAIYVRSSAYR